MKRLLLFSLLLVSSLVTKAQMIGIEVEEYAVHTGMVGSTDLTGYTTYRVYAVLGDPDDFVSAIFGLAGKPLEIRTTTSFWQTPLGGATGDVINPAIFGVFPETQYDSFVTIGRTISTDPGSAITAQQSGALPWVTDFEAGGNIYIDGIVGGAWFTLFGATATNGFAGPDNKVLIGQFTTDGEIDGYVNAQIFLNGVQADDQEFLCYSFSSVEGAVAGCPDPSALNYDPTATYEDCSCEYPCTLEIGSLNVTPITCFGQSNGTAQIVAAGQQGGAQYVLDGGNTLAVGNYINLAAGNHTIVITDSEGCQITETFVVPNPGQITATLAVTSPISCNGAANGQITATSTGGNGGNTYSLQSNMSNSNTTGVFSNLTPGQYTVYITDQNGCTGQSTSLNITQPSAVVVNVSASAAATCSDSSDGTIVCLGFGGAGGLQYSIDNVNFQTSNVFNVPAGTYSVYTVDVNGCGDVTNNPVTITAPAAIGFSDLTTDPTCNGTSDGYIDVAANGGNGGFTYSIDGVNFSNVSEWSDLAGGDYTIMAIDDEGCEGSVVITLTEPSAISAGLSSTDPLCADDTNGSITVTATGGTPDYTYSIDGGTATSNPVFSGLAGGDYTIMITDANGCTMEEAASLTNPTAIDGSGVSVEESAVGAGDGSIDLTVSGGTGDYTFDWSGTGGFSADTEDVNGLSGGSYTVIVTDENGCSWTSSFDVTTGINELANGVGVALFPNPTTGLFTLNLTGLNGQNVNVVINDAQGRVVAQEMLNAGRSEYVKNFDLTFAADGFYFMQVTVGGYATTLKVLKQ
ncbi:MAG: hypothetical protein RL226_186 [Bacteroidota bacterium]